MVTLAKMNMPTGAMPVAAAMALFVQTAIEISSVIARD